MNQNEENILNFVLIANGLKVNNNSQGRKEERPLGFTLGDGPFLLLLA